MTDTGITESEKSQLDKFKTAARELECDDDDERFKERLGRIVAPKGAQSPKENKS